MTNADTDRSTIRAGLLEAERLLLDTNVDVEDANAQLDRLKPLTSQWAERNALLELITPLLDRTEAPYVRMGAASILLHRGYPDLANRTLEDVRDNAGPPAASLADAALLSQQPKQP